jgi:hypothetical protein
VLKLETDLGTLIGAITDAFNAVGLSSPVHGGGVAQSATEGASPLAGTSSSLSA